jgi:hypothetical protein
MRIRCGKCGNIGIGRAPAKYSLFPPLALFDGAKNQMATVCSKCGYQGRVGMDMQQVLVRMEDA